MLQILTQVNVVRRECEIVSVGEGAGHEAHLVLGAQSALFKMGTPVTASPSPPETGSSQLW